MEKMMAGRKELPREGKKTALITDQQLLESMGQMETKGGKKNLMKEPSSKRKRNISQRMLNLGSLDVDVLEGSQPSLRAGDVEDDYERG